MTHRQSQFLSVVGTWHWQPVPVGSFDTWTDVGWCWWGHVAVRAAIGGGVKRTNCALMVPDGVYQLKPTYSHLSHVRRRPALQFDNCRSNQENDHEEEVHFFTLLTLSSSSFYSRNKTFKSVHYVQKTTRLFLSNLKREETTRFENNDASHTSEN